MKFVLKVLFTALGVLAAASIVPGIVIASFGWLFWWPWF